MVRVFHWRSGNRGKHGRGALLLAALMVGCLVLSSSTVAQQSEQREGSLLPATTGDPLTVKPTDLPDVSCTVARWDKSGSKPVLTLLCPPQAIFAPLRVYVKLSWMQPRNVPHNYQEIIAPANAATKIRTTKISAWVWLGMKEPNRELHYDWIPFDGVVDVALIVDAPNSHRHLAAK
jgi:hypothetical protein